MRIFQYVNHWWDDEHGNYPLVLAEIVAGDILEADALYNEFVQPDAPMVDPQNRKQKQPVKVQAQAWIGCKVIDDFTFEPYTNEHEPHS